MNKIPCSWIHTSRLALLLFVACVILFAGVAPALAAPPPPDGQVSQAGAPPARHPKLDSSLAALAGAAQVSIANAKTLADSKLLTLSDSRVQVQIATHPAGLPNAVQAVSDAGGEVTGVGWGDTLIQAWLPFGGLEAVAAHPDVHFVYRPLRAFPAETLQVGNSTTEALGAFNAPAWHTAGYTGSGVKIGIIDGGFQGYQGLLGVDLPAAVTVKNFVDGESDAQADGTTQHGTACVEVIHDVAPGAQLYLAKIYTDLDLEQAVTWLIAQRVDVISTSVGFYNGSPGDGTGHLAALVRQARQAGILWVTAAGNDRESHWGGAYSNRDADRFHEFANGGDVNCFSFNGMDCLAFPLLIGEVNILVRWSDWQSVNQDFDVHLVRWDGQSWVTVASSTNVQNGGPGQTPTEWIAAGTIIDFAPYGFRIERIRGNRSVNFEVFTPGLVGFGFRPTEFVRPRSLLNLADAPDAVTVAALDVNSLAQEFYSSEGPTNGPGGVETGGLLKPDISGFANVSTQSYGPGVFNGTSAATPHVAGAAALVLSANPGYTSDQVEAFLQARAMDLGQPGVDLQHGYGRLYLGDPPGASSPQPVLMYLPLVLNGRELP